MFERDLRLWANKQKCVIISNFRSNAVADVVVRSVEG
jgi:hypothetical protein